MTIFDCWLAGPDDERTCFLPEGRDAFFNLKEGIQAGRYRGEQVDPLTWQAEMTKTEISAFIQEVYGPAGQYERQNAGPMEHMADKMRAARAFVAALPDDRPAKITADEF
jgi:hypothetical protein